VTSRLLEKQKVETCAQLQAFSLAKLKDKFGAKTGESWPHYLVTPSPGQSTIHVNHFNQHVIIASELQAS